MSRKSRLREKATHHYQGDDPLLEKSIEQTESAASAKLPSEAINLTRQAGAMGSISKESLSLIHISEPTRLLSISYAVFCLKKKT